MDIIEELKERIGLLRDQAGERHDAVAEALRLAALELERILMIFEVERERV
jgi:hypothetical protein